MRATLTVITGALALLAVAASGAWLARVHLAQAWLDRTLAAEGYPAARFDVTAVGLQRIVVESLALQDAYDVQVERLRATYALLSVLFGSLESVQLRVEGLRASVDLRGRTTAANGQAGPSPGSADWLATLERLAGVRIASARVRIDSGLGTWRLQARGDIRSTENGLAGRIDAVGRNERLRVDAAVGVQLTGEHVVGELSLREDDGFRVELTGRAEAPWPNARVRVEVESVAPGVADLPWALLDGPSPSAGTLRVYGRARGRMALGSGWQAWPALIGRIAGADWSGQWRIQGRGLTVPHRLTGVDVEARGALVAGGGLLQVRAHQPPRLRVGGVHPSVLERLDVPLFAEAHARGPFEVTWEGDPVLRLKPAASAAEGFRVAANPRWQVTWPERAGSMRVGAEVDAAVGANGGVQQLSVAGLRMVARGWHAPGTRLDRAQIRGHVEGIPEGPAGAFRASLKARRLRLDGARLQGVTASIPLRVTAKDGPPRVQVGEGASAMVRRWRIGDRLRGTTELRLRLPHARVALEGPMRWAASVAVEPFELAADVAGRTERAAVVPGRVRVGGQGLDGAVVTVGTRARILERELRLRSIEARLEPGGLSPFARLSIGRISHGGRSPWFRPITLSAQVRRNAGGYSLAGEGRWIDADVRFRITGEAAPAAGAAAFDLIIPSVRFSSDGPQPGELAPALARLKAVQGRVQGRMQWRIRPDTLEGEARLRLDGVALSGAGVRVRGIRGEMRFDRLRPLRTAGEQTLRIGRIETAVPLTDARIRWIGGQGGRGRFRARIASARANVLGGQARFGPETIDPTAPVHNLSVRLKGVELERLLARMDIAGLRGSGRLDGRIPLTLGERGFAVRNAHLRGAQGHVALRSAGADAALADSGRDARLMLAALRDFDYETMEATIDAPLTGTGRVGIRLEGRNPGVLSGKRFSFDVALAGDVTPLLDAMARGQPLSDERIAHHLDLRELP